MARDETCLRVHLLPVLGARQVGSITASDVQGLVNGLVAAGKAPRTVRRIYGTLRAVLNHAVARDLILRSPCRGIKLPKVDPLERPVITPEEVAGLADAVGPAFAPMVFLGAVLGLRWGECAGLRVGRLDALRGTITITEQLTRGRHGVPVFGPPKSNAGRRTLSVPAVLMELLAGHLAGRGLTGADADALVFVAPDGGPLAYENWRRRTWAPAVAAVGLPSLTFHDLRRANATAMVLDGTDLKTAQTRLGHSDPRLTLAVYAQATSAAERAAADRLGDRFMPATTRRQHSNNADQLPLMFEKRSMEPAETRDRRPRTGA